MPHPTATAWVESPLQMLGAIEHAALGADDGVPLAVLPRAGDAQLERTAAIVHELGLPFGAAVGIERRLLPSRRLPADGRWLIGDPFSGQVQARLARAVPRHLVLVDDGAITRRFARLLVAGEALLRAPASGDARVPALRRTLAATTTRTLLALAEQGRLDVTTYLAPDDPAVLALLGIGVRVRHHDFAWTRAHGFAAAAVAEGRRIVLGTAAVADGLVPAEEQRAMVVGLARTGPVSYLPHRREPAWFLRAIGRERHVAVVEPRVPVELALGGATRPLEIISRPSSAVETLTRVLAGSGSRILLAGPQTVAS